MPLFTPDSPWERCYTDFLRQLSRSHSHATQVAYTGILRRFFADATKSPEQYTRQDIEDFIYGKSDKTWTRSPDGEVTPGTTNFRLSVLSSFYKYASTYQVGHELLLQHPSPTTGVHRGKSGHMYRALSLEEFERFFAAIPRDSVIGLRDRAIFLCYFWTARRRAEVQRLRWEDIQETTIIDPDGTRRDGWVYRFQGKGHSTEDDIAELPYAAMSAIQKYLEAAGRWGQMEPQEPLFLATGHEWGGNVRAGEKRALTQAGIVRRMEMYAKQAGIEHMSLHRFRHTAARERYQAGQDILGIKELLRHTDLGTTYRYLLKLTGTADTGAKLLDAKFGQFS
jgi:integrase